MDTDAALAQALPAAVRARLLSARLSGAEARLVLDGEGLDAAARDALEHAARAGLAAQGLAAHIAVLGSKAPAALKTAPGATPAPPRIIAIASGKGGVGKSTLAANLAVALHRLGRRVGLVDADIYGPSAPRLMGNAAMRATAHDKRLIPVASAFGPAVLSMAHLVEPGKALAWRGPMAAGALGQLIAADWGTPETGGAELLIVDLPPGTGDVQLTMVQRHKPAGAVIVSTPQDLALIDAARAVQLFAQTGVPIIGLVENMAGYLCPHCGAVSDPFGSGGAEAMAREMGLDFLGRIPLTLAIRAASDAGTPPAAGDTPEAQGFARIAARLAAWLDAHNA